ncbi:MAG: HPr family phosphocarrier protein [Oscillospiraceae bacterium]|jgi:phosphocarrier protein|nr:HPr family phosphocarrier protein [Oscillospiraceae bacterium]
MKEFQYTIQDESGVHARPAGLMVRKAQSFQSDASVSFNGKKADMKRLFAIMGLNIKKGDQISVQVTGADEDAAAKELEDFLKNNL